VREATYLPISVEEVVPEISLDRVVPILQCPFSTALACPREVGLESASTGVGPRNGVAVVGPDYELE